jgi:hypothetical protein
MNELKRTIVAACEEDHVGLWEIVRIVERHDPNCDLPHIREATLALLEQLLSAGEIEAGLPAKTGRDFEAWKLPAASIVEKLHREWQPDNRPTIGEIAWFTTPVRVRKTA